MIILIYPVRKGAIVKNTSKKKQCTCHMRSHLVSKGIEDGIEWHTHEGGVSGVNGYMLLPENHPWREHLDKTVDNDLLVSALSSKHNIGYSGINSIARDADYELFDKLVGGSNELTFSSEDGWVGFDTAHISDDWGMSYFYDFQGPKTEWTISLVEEMAKIWCKIIAKVTVTEDKD